MYYKPFNDISVVNSPRYTPASIPLLYGTDTP